VPDVAAAQRRAREIPSLLPAGDGPILDFGAGTGYLVAGMRSLGIDADGVEPSAPAHELARERYGVELRRERPDPAERRYAAVTMVHVLEHLRDPVGQLREVATSLEADGTVFIEVPHAGSLRTLPHQLKESVLDLPVHLFHFTPATLGTVLNAAGYELTEVRLFNSWIVERVLARRASGPPQATDPTREAAPAGAARTDSHPARPSALRSAWQGGLAGLRRIVPGEKFQALARPRPGTEARR
jgi:SAM-dependent methyltransferase